MELPRHDHVEAKFQWLEKHDRIRLPQKDNLQVSESICLLVQFEPVCLSARVVIYFTQADMSLISRGRTEFSAPSGTFTRLYVPSLRTRCIRTLCCLFYITAYFLECFAKKTFRMARKEVHFLPDSGRPDGGMSQRTWTWSPETCRLRFVVKAVQHRIACI